MNKTINYTGPTANDVRPLVLDTKFIMGRKAKTTVSVGNGKEEKIGRVIGVGHTLLDVYFLIAPDDGSTIFCSIATACSLDP